MVSKKLIIKSNNNMKSNTHSTVLFDYKYLYELNSNINNLNDYIYNIFLPNVTYWDMREHIFIGTPKVWDNTDIRFSYFVITNSDIEKILGTSYLESAVEFMQKVNNDNLIGTNHWYFLNINIKYRTIDMYRGLNSTSRITFQELKKYINYEYISNLKVDIKNNNSWLNT